MTYCLRRNILFRSFQDPPPTINPPVLHPKTPSMAAEIVTANSPSRTTHKPSLLPTRELGRLESEEYVATDVFRIDRQTQEEIDVSLLSILLLQSRTGDFIWFACLSFPHSHAVLLQ